MLAIWDCEPRMSTMAQAATSTTGVRRAVARVESISRMPALASTAVSPANSADPQANTIHMRPG